MAPKLTRFILLTILVSATHLSARPKNIILFIGDGMGVSQLTAAKYIKGKLETERCSIGGLTTTHCSDVLVTDSAAAGTALATGHKTTKGTVSETPEGKTLTTVLEIAEENGKATGLVATSAITHATPASFAAHVPSRYMETKIAEQIASKEIEVLLGGGRAFFIPQSQKNSKRKDEQNLLKQLEQKMTVVTNEAAFRSIETPKRLAGFFADVGLPKVSEGRISLSDMTAKAIDVLSQYETGFFLMVEGSQIDWGGHAKNSDYIITETVDFDDAVGVGLDFAEQDGQTLIIVTSDHETGGYAVLDGVVTERTITKTKFSTGDHSAAMVPIFAHGPDSELFGGILDNTDVGKKLISLIKSETM